MTLRVSLVCSAGLVIALGASPRLQERSTATYRIDGRRSRFTIDVGKTGAFSFVAGHAHEVETQEISGAIEFTPEDLERSAVHLEVPTASLRVTGKGEPPDDVPQVQETMLSERVLDVKRYPEILFESTTITSVAAGGSSYSVVGRITLHGVTKSISLPVALRQASDTLTASGATSIKQTDFGITPVSVAGVVKVKDDLGLSFTIVAARSPG
jgi:polyisoprenoid-binding protein YceI